MTGRKGKVIKGTAWIGISRVVTAVIGFISTVVLARLLTPGDFGLVAIASAAAAIIAVVADMPLSQAAIHHDDPDEEHFHTIWTFGLIRGLFMGALIGGSAPFVADFYGDQRLTAILLALAGSAALNSMQNPMLVLFERELVFWQSIVISLTERTTSFAVSVIIAWLYQSYWALVLGIVAAAFVRLVLTYVFKPYRPRFMLTKAKELLSFSIWLTLGSWIHAVAYRADPLVLGYFIKPNVLGYYSMSSRIQQMTIGELMSPITAVLFPALSRMKHDAAQLRAAYLRVQSVSATIALPASAGFAALSAPIVLLILGEQWLPAIPVLQVLVLMGALKAMEWLIPLALATGNTKALFWRQTQSLIIRVPLLFGGIMVGQATALGVLMGAVLGMAVSQMFMTLWAMGLVKRLSGTGWRAQFSGLLRPLLASAGMASAVLLALRSIGNIATDLEGYATLLALVLLGIAAYMLLLFGLWLMGGKKSGPETELVHLFTQVTRRLRRVSV